MSGVNKPGGNYLPVIIHSGIAYVSGQLPRRGEDLLCAGKVGAGVSVEEAYAHARLTGLNLIAVMHAALGDLARVRQVVKLFGMVNAAPDFADHPAVINGCSDLLVAVFGPAGMHARSAIGQGSLPGQITVEIEAVVAID